MATPFVRLDVVHHISQITAVAGTCRGLSQPLRSDVHRAVVCAPAGLVAAISGFAAREQETSKDTAARSIRSTIDVNVFKKHWPIVVHTSMAESVATENTP